MQIHLLATLLLLTAAGCAPSNGTPPPAEPGAGAPADAQAEVPGATAPARRMPTGSVGAGQSQGIRVGEPAPNDPRGPRNPAPGTSWRAFGNEPFWNVEARGTTLVFTTPDDQKGVTLLGRRVPSLVGTVILGSGPRGDFHFGVTPGECSDGMSGENYDYAATFIYAGTTWKGCAEPR